MAPSGDGSDVAAAQPTARRNETHPAAALRHTTLPDASTTS
jgi:hypothetical protein